MAYTQYFSYFYELCADLLGLYLYQDYIEVCLFIFAVYKGLTWLKQDHTKHLVMGSYLYFFLLSSSYYLSCNILFSTLLTLAPVCMMLCIIIHQKQLQKNFVLASTKHSSPKTVPHKNWIDTLIQSCLIASHHNKHITCIIERNDHIHSLLQAPFVLHLPIQKSITDLLLASNNLSAQTLLWVNQSGMIHSINVTWHSFLTNELLLVNAKTNTTTLNHEAATLLSQKTDAVVFEINAANTNTIWYQGKCMQNITVQQLLVFAKEILNYQNQISNQRKSDDKTNHASS